MTKSIGTVKQIWRYPVKSMAGEQLQSCSVANLGIPGDRGWALRDETKSEMTNGKQFPMLMQCAARYRHEPENASIPNAEMIFPDGTTTDTDATDVNDRLSRLLGKSVSLWPLQPASDSNHYRRKSKAARVFGRLARYKAFRKLLPTLTSFGNANAELRDTFSREPDEPIPDVSVLPPEVLEFTSPPGTYFDAFPIHLLTTASLDAMSRFNAEANWDVRRFRPNFLIQTPDGLEGLIEADWNGRIIKLGTVELRCEIPTMRCGMTMHAQRDLPKDPSILRAIVRDADQNLGTYARVIVNGEVKIGDEVWLE